MENKIKHLEMIEKVIERMAKNSFQLKGWAMTLVSIVGALGAKDANKKFMFLGAVPIIGFWVLDAFYLQKERLYRALYRDVCETAPDKINFNMNTKVVKLTEEEKKRVKLGNCFKSVSISVFYGILALTFGIVLLALLCGHFC